MYGPENLEKDSQVCDRKQLHKDLVCQQNFKISYLILSSVKPLQNKNIFVDFFADIIFEDLPVSRK